MGIQKIRVSAQEAKKYANVSRGNGEDFFEATVYTDENGNIDAERTYTLSYRNGTMDQLDAQRDRDEKSLERKARAILSSDFACGEIFDYLCCCGWCC